MYTISQFAERLDISTDTLLAQLLQTVPVPRQ